MNIKKEQNYYVLLYDDATELWEIKKSNLWYHEAKTMKDENDRKLLVSKIVDKEHLEEFIVYANGQYKN